MLPGSFVERQRACGRPNCHCADGKQLHSQYQISILIDGKPKALNIPALPRDVRDILALVELIGRYQLPATKTSTSLPLRTTLLHVLYPDVVPIFDQMC